MSVLTPTLTRPLLTFFALLLLAAPAYADSEANIEQMSARLNLLNQYFEIVTSVYNVAHDPERAAVLNLQQLEDAYKAQSKPDEIIKMYQGILDGSRNQTLRNVAYMKLAEIYKRGGRVKEQTALLKKALAENTKLIK
jgi:tetratricopeptide (TPR) repeat protein